MAGRLDASAPSSKPPVTSRSTSVITVAAMPRQRHGSAVATAST